jgi:hypothetical protein
MTFGRSAGMYDALWLTGLSVWVRVAEFIVFQEPRANWQRGETTEVLITSDAGQESSLRSERCLAKLAC